MVSLCLSLFAASINKYKHGIYDVMPPGDVGCVLDEEHNFRPVAVAGAELRNSMDRRLIGEPCWWERFLVDGVLGNSYEVFVRRHQRLMMLSGEFSTHSNSKVIIPTRSIL